MQIIQIIACLGTLVCAFFAYLSYKHAKSANTKIKSITNFKINGDGNTTQSHIGSGDNVGGNKHV